MKKYIITYRSYKTFFDKEVFTTKEAAEKRMEQLKTCKFVDKLEIKEG
jgi:hypothetical protein